MAFGNQHNHTRNSVGTSGILCSFILPACSRPLQVFSAANTYLVVSETIHTGVRLSAGYDELTGMHQHTTVAKCRPFIEIPDIYHPGGEHRIYLSLDNQKKKRKRRSSMEDVQA